MKLWLETYGSLRWSTAEDQIAKMRGYDTREVEAYRKCVADYRKWSEEQFEEDWQAWWNDPAVPAI